MNVKVYTDGACKGNPGPGGWAFLIVVDEELLEADKGGDADTTNNKMELQGVIEGLKAAYKLLGEGEDSITVVSASKYIVDAFEKGWLAKWCTNGWKTGQKKPVRNKDQWEQLLNLVRQHKVQWEWVHGHRGNAFNEIADQLAVEAKNSVS